MINEHALWTLLFFIGIGSLFSLRAALQSQKMRLRIIERKLDALLLAQGITLPALSYEGQALALEGNKIGAIQLHRDAHPTMSLLEAKREIDEFVADNSATRVDP